MKCPNCGANEKILVKLCQSCGGAFVSQDLQELDQLNFLLDETASWGVDDVLREPYINRLESLWKRVVRDTPVELEVVPEEPSIPKPTVEEVGPAAPPSDASPPKVAPESKPIHPKEQVPFDQWLLSERNIKIALYSGGLLLFLAGLIFIGVNWTRIPGPGKFGITLMFTGLMYLGGYLMFQRPALRLGGVALLGVASGFLTLNFAVLQIYVLGPGGLREDVMWLIASPLCLLLYLLTAYWTSSDLFSYISLTALGSTIAAALVVVAAPWHMFILAAGLLALALLALSETVKNTAIADFTYLPLLFVSQGLMPLAFAAAINEIWLVAPGCRLCPGRNFWLSQLTLFFGVLYYSANAYWRRSYLFTYLGIVAVVCAIAGVLILLEAPLLLFILAGSLLALVLLGLARAVQSNHQADFTSQPLLVSAQATMPIAILAAIGVWMAETGCIRCPAGSPWLELLALFLGVLFYVATDALHKWLAVRWVATILLSITVIFTMIELNFSSTATGITLMVLALVYLGIGYALESRGERRSGGWPLYATAYAIALFVTYLAIEETDDLAKLLVGDVILMAVSAAIHRDYRWVYGAVWLFMLPIYLVIDLFVQAVHFQGLLMGLLGLNYAAAGYILGRRELRLGGPFLTAAAFLSIVSVSLTWTNPLVASLVLGLVASLYLMTALWLGWEWLLLPALLAVEMAVYTINSMFFTSFAVLELALILSYFALGGVLALLGIGLGGAVRGRWTWPVYLVAAINLGGAYLAGFDIGGWLVIGLSAVFALLALTFAWLERDWFAQKEAPPVLAYLGIGAVLAGHFYAIDVANQPVFDVWPGYTAGLCALFIMLAWTLRRDPLADIYGTPLRIAGLWSMVIPLIGAIYLFEPFLGAVTFAIAGAGYALDAVLRRILKLGYLGTAAFVITIWALLLAFEISEPQAYALPLGLALLGIGWNERRLGGQIWYRIPTFLGLLVLMGSAFVQSLPREGFVYALVLLVESLLAAGWGYRTRLRSYVQVGGLALIGNAIVQLGSGFIDLPRWLQLGITGGILLGGGVAALFKRETILATRQRITEEWRRWEP